MHFNLTLNKNSEILYLTTLQRKLEDLNYVRRDLNFFPGLLGTVEFWQNYKAHVRIGL